jgi:hypothetical protein
VIKLNDSQGKKYGDINAFDTIEALAAMAEFKSNFIINPGFVGINVKLYDLPKDLTGLKIVDDGFEKTTRKPSPDSFSTSGGKGPDSSAGQELVGKAITEKARKLDVKVTKVERLQEATREGKTIKPDGVWIVVVYDITNTGDKPGGLTTFNLQDSEGRVYESSDFDLEVALGSKYKNELSINPGQSGSGFKVFEVVKEASGFRLVEGL